MRIVGEWRRFSDWVTRPIVEAEMLSAAGNVVTVRFLIDSGADCTALNAATLVKLALPHQRPQSDTHIRGVAGEADYITIRSAIEFKLDDGGAAKVRGEFVGLTDPDASDLCVLGRDVTDNFDVILSRRRNDALLLAPTHQYQVNRA
jgi:hypothetical protein